MANSEITHEGDLTHVGDLFRVDVLFDNSGFKVYRKEDHPQHPDTSVVDHIWMPVGGDPVELPEDHPLYGSGLTSGEVYPTREAAIVAAVNLANGA